MDDSINPTLGIRQPQPVEQSPNTKEATERKKVTREGRRERRKEPEDQNGQEGDAKETVDAPEKEQGKIVDIVV